MTMTMTLTLTREVKPEEIDDLVFGCGALGMSWWHGAEVGRYDHSLGITAWVSRGREDSRIYEDDLIRLWHWPAGQEEGREKTELALYKIIEAVESSKKYLDEDVLKQMWEEELGYADAIAADIVLQMAVFGELIYG